MKKIPLLLSIPFATVPLVALAQPDLGGRPTLLSVVQLVTYYLNVFLVFLIGVAVVFFVYHVVKYFMLPDSDRKEGGMYILYSVIGFFVILSFWGLVNIVQNTFGLQNDRFRMQSWSSMNNIFPSGNVGQPINSRTPSYPGGDYMSRPTGQ